MRPGIGFLFALVPMFGNPFYVSFSGGYCLCRLQPAVISKAEGLHVDRQWRALKGELMWMLKLKLEGAAAKLPERTPILIPGARQWFPGYIQNSLSPITLSTKHSVISSDPESGSSVLILISRVEVD
jgi:hypothetical protein